MSKPETGEVLPPEPELVDPPKKRGRPPGSKTKVRAKVDGKKVTGTVAAPSESAPKKASINFGPFLDLAMPIPPGPGGSLRVDPMRATVRQAIALGPLDLASWAVARQEKKTAAAVGRPERAPLAARYPSLGLSFIQKCFDALTEGIDFEVNPWAGLLISYLATLAVATYLYVQDKEEANADSRRQEGRGTGGAPAPGFTPDHHGDRGARNGENNVHAPLLGGDGAEAPLS